MAADGVGSILDGRYRLDEVIGTGTMGTVYRATQLTVRRPVAIKVLNASLKHHPKLQQRFEVEARAIARLNHPNVLTLFDFAYSMDKDLLYMVVEFIEGETLSKLIARGVTPGLATHIAYQIASALAHAHEGGIVHRDLKPGNVMLSHEKSGERVKVLDFGLAKIFDGTAPRRTTEGSDMYGAPGYMSPEQCSGEEAGPPTDVYALGCILFEMLEGRLPFDFEGPAQLMQAHVYAPAPTPENPHVSNDVRQLVRELLSKKAEDRPTAQQVLQRLRPRVDVDNSMETLMRAEALELIDASMMPAALSAEIERVEAKHRAELRTVVGLALVIIVVVIGIAWVT